MPRELAALKVKIGLRQDGKAAYPNFNTLAVVQAAGINWAEYVDRDGEGWVYDKTSGHRDDTVDSPLGQQWGVLLVPGAFADEAVVAFPNECSILTEAECQTFWETKGHAHVDEFDRDEQALVALRAELELRKDLVAEDPLTHTPLLNALRTKIAKALNPDDAQPGVRRNKRKMLADAKTKNGFTIRPRPSASPR